MAKKTAPLSTLKVCAVTIHRVHDQDSTPEHYQVRVDEGPEFYTKDGVSQEEAERYIREDRKRVEAFDRGQWGFIGIYATAQIVVDGEIREVQSMGLWGIESDSGEKYLKSVEKDELDDLKEKIKEAGARCQRFEVARAEGR